MSRTAIVPAVATGLLLVLWAGTAHGQADPKPAPTVTSQPSASHAPGQSAGQRQRVTTRVAVGERAPDFELDGINETKVKLSKLRGEWVMLFFVERRESLDVVAPVAQALRGIGVHTLTVCWEKAYVLGRQFAGRTLDYTPLSDPTGDIISLYGLLGGLDRDSVQPGFVLIDPRGMVRLALLGNELPSEDTSQMVRLAVRGE